jgi:phosphate transport system substrate-binding protein
VVKDAVVAMVNVKNPVLATLQKRGVSRDALSAVWMTAYPGTWGKLAGSDINAPIRVYTRSDACGAAATWAEYLGGKQEHLKGTGVYGDPGLAEAVRKDRLGIGYNNVGFAFDPKTEKAIAGLAVLPLDVNANGTLDPDEAIYGSRKALLDAIAAGRYPSPPARELLFVTHGKPAKPLITLFLKWVLADGQAFVAEAGYVALPREKLDSELRKLAE